MMRLVWFTLYRCKYCKLLCCVILFIKKSTHMTALLQKIYNPTHEHSLLIFSFGIATMPKNPPFGVQTPPPLWWCYYLKQRHIKVVNKIIIKLKRTCATTSCHSSYLLPHVTIEIFYIRWVSSQNSHKSSQEIRRIRLRINKNPLFGVRPIMLF